MRSQVMGSISRGRHKPVPGEDRIQSITSCDGASLALTASLRSLPVRQPPAGRSRWWCAKLLWGRGARKARIPIATDAGARHWACVVQ